MRHEYVIDGARNLVRKTNHGSLTVAEEIEIIGRITADPAYRKGMDALCDFSDGSADWSLAEIDEFRVFVAKAKTVVGQCRWAIVIPRSANRVTARIFIALHQAFEDTIDVRLFETVPEAEAWLAVPIATK